MKFISFDEYYTRTQYNSFLMSAANNNVKFTEFIKIRPPFNFVLRIDDKDIPKFLDYELEKENRWLVSKMIARYPNEEFQLRRKDNDPKQEITRFVENDVLSLARVKPFVCVFYFSGNNLLEWSDLIQDKIYILGLKGGFKIAVTFNKLILNVIEHNTIILIEEDGDFRGVGEIEQRVNYLWKPKEKITHKTLESMYYDKGKFYPIQRPLFKIT